MSRIIVEAATSDAAVCTVLGLLNCGFEAKTAWISYNLRKGLPFTEDTAKYPLILDGTLKGSPLTIHVYSVTAGYRGAGPHAMVEILNAAGFKFENSDILTKARANLLGQIELVYKR